MFSEESEPKTARLNININADTAQVIADTRERYGINTTEAVRRAVAVYKFFEDCREEGQTIQLVKDDTVIQVRLLMT